jgi:hypothetical protein
MGRFYRDMQVKGRRLQTDVSCLQIIFRRLCFIMYKLKEMFFVGC